MTKYILIGAGGHAKAVVEAIRGAGGAIVAYVDPREAAWLNAARISDDGLAAEVAAGSTVVMGIGGVETDSLAKRLALLQTYRSAGIPFRAVIHPAAYVSPTAVLGEGAIVLAGAVVQPGVSIGPGAIINTLAVVEHDSEIGEGSHVAPGAIVLGGCRIGECCMVGAGAVILPGAMIADHSLVPAGTRYPS
jgi:sugar O-acyltransferase (sialic acid O-acetyltransferase NeuD family)